MPPKARITREMIIDAGFEIIRERGIEHLNARTLSERLGCSTQPVLYHFQKIEDIKRAIYRKADAYHSEYITTIQGYDPMKEIGLQYVRFAVSEKNLFRFLFQSNEFSGKDMGELIDAEALSALLGVLAQEADVNPEQAKTLFRSLFLCAHGYASMLANNAMKYEEETISADLERMMMGAVYAAKETL